MNRKVTSSLVIWSLVLAREKHKKLNRAMRARKRGFVVLCDRYPQAEIGGINDGRMLHAWEASGSRWKRLIAELESRPYRRAEQLGPDLVLRLRVTPAVAHLRKPSEDMDKLELRREIVESLRFPGARRGVIDIDADQGLEAVLLAVKQELWPEL